MYNVYLDLKEKKCNVNPDRFAEGGQDIYFFVCIFWTYLHFYDVSFRVYHIRCLNIFKFGHIYHFWDKKQFWRILTDVLFSRSILTIFDRPFYVAHDRDRVIHHLTNL